MSGRRSGDVSTRIERVSARVVQGLGVAAPNISLMYKLGADISIEEGYRRAL